MLCTAFHHSQTHNYSEGITLRGTRTKYEGMHTTVALRVGSVRCKKVQKNTVVHLFVYVYIRAVFRVLRDCAPLINPMNSPVCANIIIMITTHP